MENANETKISTHPEDTMCGKSEIEKCRRKNRGTCASV
jgi:hypothetical protein